MGKAGSSYGNYEVATFEGRTFLNIDYYWDDPDVSHYWKIDGVFGKWWEIIHQEDNRILLLSSTPVARRMFDTHRQTILWKDCTLRKWLNGAFRESLVCKDSVVKVELQTVREPKINPYKNDYDSTYTTEDYVFLLSREEAMQYIESNEVRRWPGLTSSSPGWALRDLCEVGPKGNISRTKIINDYSKQLVRAAFWADFSKAQ